LYVSLFSFFGLLDVPRDLETLVLSDLL